MGSVSSSIRLDAHVCSTELCAHVPANVVSTIATLFPTEITYLENEESNHLAKDCLLIKLI